MMILSAIIDLIVIARSDSDEAIQLSCRGKAGLLRGACHRARVRATRWLAMTNGDIDSTSFHRALARSVSVVPLYQFEGDALGTLEEPQLSADVVHLVAQHGYAVGHEVRGGRLNVIDAEREVIEASFSQIGRVRTRIGPWGRV